MKHDYHARRVFKIEAESILGLQAKLDDSFNKVVDSIIETKGRVIICGMGKSGIIGKKISATLASTGTPSFSMHPGEAFHGDLGMVVSDDIFIAISNSGETDEVIKLLPFLKENRNLLVSLTGNSNSTLARESNFHLDVSVKEEACPLKLAPTSSTTATLAMGDALAIALMEARSFMPENFARFHPGGSLGRKLLVKVRDEMLTENLPTAADSDKFIDLLHIVTSGEQGLAIIVDENLSIKGLVTDGDIRRALENFKQEVFSLEARDLMTSTPITIDPHELASYGESIMEEKQINKLIVAKNNRLLGILRK